MTAARLAVVGSFMQAACWQLARLPGPGESLAATSFWTAPAGKGLAVALGAHRLGAAVDLLLAVGEDAAGDALMERLRQEGLAREHVRRYPGPSGQGAGWLSADGHNAIATFDGANARLDATQVAQAGQVLAHAALVYAQFETSVDAALAAFERARRHGACTVLNPSPWKPLDESLLRQTQVLLVNETEALLLLAHAASAKPARRPPLALAGTGDADGAESWREAATPLWAAWPGDGQRLLVVTLGAHGCLALMPDGSSHLAAGRAVDVHDSIGAGDAFAAGLCTALAEGLPLCDALQRANACGAFAVGQRGILEGLPTSAELATLLRSSI